MLGEEEVWAGCPAPSPGLRLVRRLHLRTHISLQITDFLVVPPPPPPSLYKNIQIVTKHEIMLRENMAKFKKSWLRTL